MADWIDRDGFRANVGIVLMRDDGRVFLGGRSGGRGWQFPQGGIRRNEPFRDALYRELEEETGYRAGKMVERARFWTTPGFTTEFMYLYEATELVKTSTNPDEDEVIEVDVVHRDDALRMVRDGRIEDAKSILGLLRVLG